MLRYLLLLACLASWSYSLTCQKCSETVTVILGFPIEDGSPSEDTTCVPTVCTDDQDVCVYGYSHINYKGPFSTGEEGGNIEVDMNIIMNWFKDCGKASETSCDKMTESMSIAQNEDKSGTFSVPECDINTCTTDNCNDKTVKEINPTPLEAMSCYTCQKTTVNGIMIPDDSSQPECSESNKKQCPLGTETCISGNVEMMMNGTTLNMEYIKDCGNSYLSNCDTLEDYMKMAMSMGNEAGDLKINSCNLESCKGDLCNTKSAQEVADFSSGFVPAASIALASILFFYWS
ncbi:hypothetical protein ACHWQZ_G000513 [Mnemiopsis leidyi]